ncbi:MAG TPA: hypothetical protein ENK49_13760 [Gammaproteobacteria bacterium]|nr:hypothetical protein [Gammaproteobacteria bacterium]
MGWQALLSGLRERRRRRRLDKAAARARKRALDEAIEHVVEEINPKLRALGGYRKKLRPCVKHTLDYCNTLVTDLPASVEVSSRSWGQEPAVRAFFSNAGEVQQVFSQSQELRDFFDRHLQAEYCHVLLSMERRERSVLGMEMHGDMIKRDVRQTTVNFTDHRVVTPSVDEQELKEKLRQRAFESLIAFTLERISDLVAARHLAQEQQQLLNMRRKIAQLKGNSLEPLLRAPDSMEEHASVQAGQAAEGGLLSTLDDYIDRIADVLCKPENWLRVYPVSLRLNEMNVKTDAASDTSGHTLQLTEAALGEQLKRTLFIARFPRGELLPKQDFLA